MIYLPLVERELRLAARHPSTYRTRLCTASVIVAITFCMIVVAKGSAARLAQTMFSVLTVLAFGYCLFAGVLFTADALSVEKREGTLGFLFLTDLRGYDVVLSKLVVNSLHATFGLLATLPVLGWPLILGGVTGTEFWRVSLLLLNLLFFSLALGLLISAIGKVERTVMMTTLALMIFFTAILPAIWKFATSIADNRWWDILLLLPCPSYAFKMSGSVSKAGSYEYWLSMGTILVMSLACIASSSILLPRVFQEGTRAPWVVRWAEHLRRWRFRLPRRGFNSASQLLEINPFLWLVSRDRLPKILLRCFALIIFGFCFWAYPVLSKGRNAFMAIAVFTSLGFHLAIKGLMAAEACRRINEDKRSGALDLLLATRLNIHSILEGQMFALSRLFWMPALAVIILNLIWAVAPASGNHQEAYVVMGGVVILVIDFYALSWVGMRVALRGQAYRRAVLETFGRVMFPAWAVLCLFIFVSMNGSMAQGTAEGFFFLWFVGSGIYDFALVSWAKAGVNREVFTRGPRVTWNWVPTGESRWRMERKY